MTTRGDDLEHFHGKSELLGLAWDINSLIYCIVTPTIPFSHLNAPCFSQVLLTRRGHKLGAMEPLNFDK